MSLIIFALIFGTSVYALPIQNIPPFEMASFESMNPVKSSMISPNSIVTSTVSSRINDYDQLDDESNEDNNIQIDHKLYAKVQETPAQIHDNVDKTVNVDISKLFTDINMDPGELTNIVRKRRNIRLNEQFNQRHKRDLSNYIFYDTNPVYRPFSEEELYIRPIRSDSSNYWYPLLSKRNIRSDTFFYDPSEWNRVYTDSIENDDTDEEQMPFYLNDEGDNENNYQYNLYPILSDESDIPFDNLKLQQEYNVDDLPIDDYEDFFSTAYEPLENYFE